MHVPRGGGGGAEDIKDATETVPLPVAQGETEMFIVETECNTLIVQLAAPPEVTFSIDGSVPSPASGPTLRSQMMLPLFFFSLLKKE